MRYIKSQQNYLVYKLYKYIIFFYVEFIKTSQID